MSEQQVWNELGNIYINSGAFDQAIKAYNMAVELDAGFGSAYSNLGLAYARLHKHGDAITHYQRSIELLENFREKALSWHRMGTSYRSLHDQGNAFLAFRRAVELDPDTAAYKIDFVEIAKELDRPFVIEPAEPSVQETFETGQPEFEPDVDVETSKTQIDEVAVVNEFSEELASAESVVKSTEQEKSKEDPTTMMKMLTSLRKNDSGINLSENMDVKVTLGTVKNAIEAETSTTPDAEVPLDDIPSSNESFQDMLTIPVEGAALIPESSANMPGEEPAVNEEVPVGEFEPSVTQEENELTEASLSAVNALISKLSGEVEQYFQEFEDDESTTSESASIEPVDELVEDVEGSVGIEEESKEESKEEPEENPDRSINEEKIKEDTDDELPEEDFEFTDENDDPDVPVDEPEKADIQQSAVTSTSDATSVVKELGAASGNDHRNNGANNAQVWFELGNVFYNANAYDEAMMAYQEAIEMDGEFGTAKHNLALACIRKGHYDRAAELLSQSINTLSNDSEKALSWNELGDVFRVMNEYEKAIDAYRMADKLDPNIGSKKNLAKNGPLSSTHAVA